MLSDAILSILSYTEIGDFTFSGISGNAFAGTVNGVAPQNRCRISGEDDGKLGSGRLERSGQGALYLLMCYNTGNDMEWRAVGGASRVEGSH